MSIGAGATHRALAAGLVAACLAAWPGARAQQQAPPPVPQREKNEQAPQVFKVQVNLVNQFVTVRDKHNAIVADLVCPDAAKGTAGDFRVFEDGVEQKIESCTKEMNLPLTMAMLLDTSGSMDRMLSAEQETASLFLERVMKKGDETTLISFDQDADELTDFTGSVRELERGLSRARINEPYAPVTPGTVPDRAPRGTVFYDAIYLAAREKLSSQTGRKAIIVLTDAVDNGSRVRLEEAIEAAERTDAVVHILLIADPGSFFSQGSGAGVAHKIAEETGGRMIEVKGAKRLAEAFEQIVEELRSQYVVSYYPSNTTHDGRFRKVKIEVTRPDTKVLARKGYYAPKN
ncbi:MAG TPA: VWA domain-containing protein [Candidatus Acidoferrales bacterium]|nr:VWA domain-containing protein [Candidatus Acidoferrales bacterium]